MDFTESSATEAVLDSFAETDDPRLRELLGSIVRHLHEIVRETRPTIAEWETAIDFLTRTGQKCTDVRQEFILLSDILGVSMLVETINGDTAPEATESTVLGPFHMVESPPRELGDSIDLVGTGERCVVTGTVTTVDGKPVPGATLDVWQADENGFYDVQQPDKQPSGNNRGLFTADDEGRFWFKTVTPRYYPIPTDGPAGELLAATARHPYRPAHIHFLVSAPGCETLTTHVFPAGGEYIDSDAVFAVKGNLVREFGVVDDAERAREYGTTAPFRTAHFDIVLRPQDER